ncbi:D-aminoacylase, partial [bacterium]
MYQSAEFRGVKYAFISTSFLSRLLVACSLLTVVASAKAQTTPLLIQGGNVIDGTGAKRRKADVRVASGIIQEIGKLKPRPGEKVVDARGLIVAPGFIDTHSHADMGLLETPDAQSQIRQGITTAIIGQDGGSHLPLGPYLKEVEEKHVALNIASFVGHGTIRGAVMGDDYKRLASAAEVEKMAELVEQEMESGALGLSSGLEYDPGLYSSTGEVIACAKVAAAHGGIYISHVRDEENEALPSFREVIDIAEKAQIPAQISHIKLGSSNVWGKAREVLQLMADANKRGLDITADIYPYTYWRSTITVITPTRDWTDRAAWQRGLDEIGG